MSPYSSARLPSAARSASAGNPRSISAPSTMSPDAPEKQSRYNILFSFPDQVYALAEARKGVLRYDEVIEDGNPHQVPRPDQPLRQRHVVFARRRIPRGMVVEQDDCRGAAGGRGAEDFARMDNARVQRPDRQASRPQHAMFRVEQQHAALLDGQRAELRHDQLGRVERRQDLRAQLAAPHQASTADLDG